MKSRAKIWFLGFALSLLVPCTRAFAQLTVSLTFDDGLLSATTAQNLLDAHGMKGTFYIISGLIGTDPSYYLPMAPIQAIAADGHEIGGHTITHPDLTTLTVTQQMHEICDGRAQLIADGFSPNSFAYPYGNSTAATQSIVKSCYNNGRGAWCNYPNYPTPNDQNQGTCVETIPPPNAGDINDNVDWIQTEEAVSNTTTLNDLETYVQNGELTGSGWVVLQFHFICADNDPTCGNGGGAAEQYGITVSTFTAFLDWLQTQPVTVSPVGKVMGVFPSTITAPAITGLVPSTMTVNGSSQTLTVNGVNFVSGATVNWNGTAVPTTFVGATSLTAQIPATDLTKVQITTITVTNPGGTTSPGTLLSLINPVPVLTTLSSTFTFVGSTATLITATGSNFVSSSTVRWNGSSTGITTTFVSSTTLNALIPASDLTAVKVDSITVFNPTPGGGTSSTQTFTVMNPLPVLTTLSSTFTLVGSSTFTLTLTGSNFVSSSTVHWNGSVISTTTFVNATTIKTQVPSSALATVGIDSVTVFNPAPGGGTSSTQTFTVGNPAPGLTLLSPSSTLAGSAATAMSVTGTNFVNGAFIQWNGVTLPTTFVSSTSLTTTIPVGDLAVATVAVVTVTNPAPGGATSSGLNFTVNNPVPALTTLSSTFTIVGSPQFILTVTGSNFVASSVIQWNGQALTTFGTPTAASMSATVPAGNLTAVGSNNITVFNSAPGGGISSVQTFTVNNPVPVLTSLSSNFAVVGGTAFLLTINGSNFVPNSVVLWNGSSRVTTFASGTQLTAQILAGDISSVGVSTVTISNPAPGGGLSSGQSYTVGYPVPALTPTSLSPNSVTVGNISPVPLTITGSNFVASSVIQWNGSSAGITTTFVNSTTLTTQIPASDVTTVGQNAVTVFTPPLGGGTSGVQFFTVGNPVPVLTSLSTNLAVVNSPAFVLTVNGLNFVGSSIVRWNGVDRVTTFVNSTQLTAQILASDLNSLNVSTITVFSPAPVGGTSSGLPFTVGYPVPVVTSLSPSTIVVGGPAIVLTVNGSNFVNGQSFVQWNGSSRITTFINGTTLTAQILQSDIAAVGSASVTVVTPPLGGGTSTIQTFTIGNLAPVLTSISPTAKVTGDHDFTLTATGSNFVATSVVQWNGSGRPTTFVNSTTLTAQIPANDVIAAGTANVTVFTPLPGGGTTSNQLFTINSGLGGIASISAPSLISVSPTAVLSGAPAFTLTITGTNFASDSIVQWNGAARPTTIISTTLVTASIPASDVTAPGSATVTVFNPGPNGGTSNGQAIAIGANQVRVHPNPWRSNVHGGQPVTFDELPADSTIKIFTSSAHWVRTLSAPAGSATWDLKNDSGDNVASGYYIYLVTNPQGRSRGILAVIR